MTKHEILTLAESMGEKDASKLYDFHPDLYVLPIEIEVSLFSQSN